jgi:signal transduction histidine kinase
MALEKIATAERASRDESVMVEPLAGITSANLADQELRHELRNALTAAIGYTGWLRRRSAQWASPRDRRAVEAIHDSLRLATRLVQDEHAAKPREHCSLRQLAAIAVGQVPPARFDDVRFNILTDDPLVGRWDAERIVQVLINVLGNAVKYSPAGTPIVIEVARHGNWGRIVVGDQGIGIEATDLEAIFEGHRTELAQLVSSGSGIGLGLSRRLVEAEGGHLGVSSKAGIGSVFWVDLPLSVPDVSAARLKPGAHRQALWSFPGIDTLRDEVTAVLAPPSVSLADLEGSEMAEVWREQASRALDEEKARGRDRPMIGP